MMISKTVTEKKKKIKGHERVGGFRWMEGDGGEKKEGEGREGDIEIRE